MINGRYLAYLTGDSMEAASGNHTSLGETQASSIKTPERTRHTAWIALSISVAAAFFSAAPAQAELKGEFIPFPEVTFHFDNKQKAHKQWIRKQHHGTYLQSTIFRPNIFEWEDDGGVIPAHSTGISFETMNEHGTHMLRYSLDVGLGPQLTPGNLKALDVLKPGDGEHNLMVVGAISHHGEARPMDDNGLFAGYIRIPSSVAGIREVEQIIFGGYAIYSPNKWHFSASALWINVDVDLASGENDASFGYGYFQPEYWLNNRWILYGRLEVTML